MKELNPYQTIASRIAYQSPFMTVIEDEIRHPDGQPGVYSYMTLPGAVVVVPLSDEHEIYLVRLWRYPIKKYSWEVPMGGKKNKEEPSLDAAKRELLEETGITANRWHQIARLHPYSSTSDEAVDIFLAQELTLADFTDTNEIAEVKKFRIDAVLQMIEDGEITNGEAVNGILLAERYVRKHL